MRREVKDRSSILTGGLVLVALGVLIVLQRTTAFGFDRSWPIFLIVIGAGMLMQRFRDVGGWIVGAVGVGFFLLRNGHLHVGDVSAYALPVFLVLVGIGMVWKQIR